MGLQATIKNSFITGIILLAPLLVTIFALQFVFGYLRSFLAPVIDGTRYVDYVGDVEIAAELLAVLIVVLVIAVIGYLAQRRVGRLFFSGLDRAVGLIPMVSVIYSSVRQMSNALDRESTRFESVALVEYPRDGLYAFGFITAESPGAVSNTIGENAVNVYMAKSPNPTAGELLMVPESQVTELDMSISRAVRLLVTTGMAEDQEELEELKEEVDEEVAEEDVDLSGFGT